MDTQQFWSLIEDARSQTSDSADAETVADKAGALLSSHSSEEIIAAQQVLWDLMATSYRSPLWAAAYLINGGCSDDGFDYFRGWLITQGREVFDRILADPDALADLPAIRDAAADGDEKECEATLDIASDAYLTATGEQLPSGAYTVQYPELDPEWDFDFDDQAELNRRLPRLAALYDR